MEAGADCSDLLLEALGRRILHEPMRLGVFIVPREAESMRGIAKHTNVRELVDDGWLHLFRIGDECRTCLRDLENLKWKACTGRNTGRCSLLTIRNGCTWPRKSMRDRLRRSKPHRAPPTSQCLLTMSNGLVSVRIWLSCANGPP